MNQDDKKEKSEETPNKKTISRYEKWDLILNGLGHILTIIAVIVAIRQFNIANSQYKLSINQVKQSVDQFNSNYEQQKKANTIAYLQSLHELVDNTDETLLEIIKYYDITNDSVSMISCDSLEKILKGNHTYRKQIEDLYMGFNQLAIGCREDFFEEKIAWIANASMICRVTKALIPYYELIEKENKLDGYGKFLRIMVFRWLHDNPFQDEAENSIKQFEKEVTRATNDSVPYIKRIPVVNK